MTIRQTLIRRNPGSSSKFTYSVKFRETNNNFLKERYGQYFVVESVKYDDIRKMEEDDVIRLFHPGQYEVLISIMRHGRM